MDELLRLWPVLVVLGGGLWYLSSRLTRIETKLDDLPCQRGHCDVEVKALAAHGD